MLFYTVGQSHIFLMMLYSGLALGALLDLIDILRRAFVAGRWMSAALDMLFCVGALAALGLVLVRAGDGELRLYALLGGLCGFLLYAGTAGPLLRRAVRLMARAIGLAVRRLIDNHIVKKILK